VTPPQKDLKQVMLERLEKLVAEDAPARRAEQKRAAARCGHVKRRLLQNEPLTGDLLEFAINTVVPNEEIVEKLKAGQKLDHYELHLMVDMYLLRARLRA